MSKKVATPVHIQIMNRNYHINCAESDKKTLKQSAQLLNDKMCELRDEGNLNGTERIAIMAALEIAHDFIHLQTRTNDYQYICDEIANYNDKLAKILTNDTILSSNLLEDKRQE